MEDHTVQTADGYLLSVQRIPHGRKSSFDGQEKEVVLLIHGILNDATSWVINFPGQSLGMLDKLVFSNYQYSAESHI